MLFFYDYVTEKKMIEDHLIENPLIAKPKTPVLIWICRFKLIWCKIRALITVFHRRNEAIFAWKQRKPVLRLILLFIKSSTISLLVDFVEEIDMVVFSIDE